MMILRPHEAVIVSTPRAGTHTMYAVAGRHGGQRFGEFHETAVPSEAAGWRRITTCRNPYTRALSIWEWATVIRQRRQETVASIVGADFTACTRWLLTRQSRRWYAAWPQVAWHARFGPHDVLRLERLAEGLALLPWYDGGPVPRECRGKHPPLSAVLTDDARLNILAWAEADFAAYGYPEEPPA